MPAFNDEFMQPAAVEGSASLPWIGEQLEDYLCERHERVVGHDNCVSNKIKLQIPADQHRCHYVKAKITVLRCPDEKLQIMMKQDRKLNKMKSCCVKPPPQLRNEFL